MFKVLSLTFLLSSCVTIIRNECAEDAFLDDEVMFRKGHKVSVSYDDKYSFYKDTCLTQGKIMDIAGWEKGVLYYRVEILCLDDKGTKYGYRLFKIPQNLLKKV